MLSRTTSQNPMPHIDESVWKGFFEARSNQHSHLIQLSLGEHESEHLKLFGFSLTRPGVQCGAVHNTVLSYIQLYKCAMKMFGHNCSHDKLGNNNEIVCLILN